MKVLAVLALMAVVTGGFVLAMIQKTEPAQARVKEPIYNTIYTFSGESQHLKDRDSKERLIQKVEVGMVGETILGKPQDGGACQLITTYKGGRITYQDGAVRECQKVSMEGIAGYPSTYVGCNAW